MVREHGPFRTASLWPRIGWRIASALIVLSFLLGFLVIGRATLGGPRLSVWASICRGLGITSDTGAAFELQPPPRVPSRIAWTPGTLALIARGDRDHGAFIALNCTACHGSQGVSLSGRYPTLAGMQAQTIFKQLDDFRAGKRASGVMQAIATVLSPQDSADVAAYFSSRRGGLLPPGAKPLAGGHGLQGSDAAGQLVFEGDPARGIPPCSACHGPSDIKLGAPSLAGQQSAYLERQLAAFAQDLRQNDINEQMRTVASQMTPAEMHAVADLYGSGGVPQATQTRLADR